jgi:hypothetical protein
MIKYLIIGILLTVLLQHFLNPKKSVFIFGLILAAVSLFMFKVYHADTIPVMVYKKLDEQNSVQVVAENL